ncbi:conserved hypothetical protein [Gammaproteobacteria bacterium]
MENNLQVYKSQRRLLLQWLITSFLSPNVGVAQSVKPGATGIQTVKDQVFHNDHPATVGSQVRGGDILETGADSQTTFVMGRSAFLLREHTRLEIAPIRSWARDFLRVANGGLLAVFGHGEPKTVRTTTAVLGIRGTGLYLETDPTRTYLCTCYGTVDIHPAAGKCKCRDTVHSVHHAGRVISSSGSRDFWVHEAPMLNHKDSELVLLESLVGRKLSPQFLKP